eukprot:gene11468-11562_t
MDQTPKIEIVTVQLLDDTSIIYSAKQWVEMGKYKGFLKIKNLLVKQVIGIEANDMINTSLIKMRLKNARFILTDEKKLQAQIMERLEGYMDIEREYRLSPKDVIDFFGNGIGIEVKIKGSAKEIYRQLERYLFDADRNRFIITKADPHVCIKLKHIFPRLAQNAVAPFHFANTHEICADLKWFMNRYPLHCAADTMARIEEGKVLFEHNINELEAIHMPDYVPTDIKLKDGEKARIYQLTGKQTFIKTKRLLLGDDTGLGKSLTAILSLFHPGTLPAAIVVQSHLVNQWKTMQVERFTNLKVHIVKTRKPYSLPAADVYIIKYSCLSGWTNIFTEQFFKSAYFDEAQELRRCESIKYESALVLSKSVEYCMGLTASPVYNYGDEIFNVLNLINPMCLGRRDDFLREWAKPYGGHHTIKDPQALGSYLREKFLFLRRTRAEVNRELPPVNKIVHTVGYDDKAVKKSEDIARQLAIRVMNSSFTDRGEAARELDMLARYTTGISKAVEVAQYVRILLENDEPVVLAGWHRDVYDIWLRELAEFKPAMYTGSESGNQKERSKMDFINGETNLLILSLRSGAGIDGLQHRCKMVVFGELDWSPKVHDQLIDRVDRDMQQEQYGSDPVIINLLGLKASQAHGIVNPFSTPGEQYSDESRMKLLAQQYLNIEKRIKQLNARIKFLLRYRRLGGIDYVNGAAARFYPSLTPKKQYDKSGRLLVIARAELNPLIKTIANQFGFVLHADKNMNQAICDIAFKAEQIIAPKWVKVVDQLPPNGGLFGIKILPAFWRHRLLLSSQSGDQIPQNYQHMTLEEIETIIRSRIKELNEADAGFCDIRWDMTQPVTIRNLYREQSNGVTLARQELEALLQKMGVLAQSKKPVKNTSVVTAKSFLDGTIGNTSILRIYNSNALIYGSRSFPIKNDTLICVVNAGTMHHNCYAIIAGLLNEHATGEFKGKLSVLGRDAQGFITNLDRYVNRREAWVIAEQAGQIVNGLIRAAPDLLEALQKAVADYGNEGGPWNVPIEPGTWIDLARKAIDKASNH